MGQGGSTRTVLDRERILRGALDFIDEHGLRELTMRRLGAQLDVEAMALYRYVPGREDLLDGVVEVVLDELHADPEVHLEERHGWQDYLHRYALGLRRVALAHPEVFPLIASRPPDAPWIRPPLRSLQWIESFFDALLGSGFSDERAVQAYRSFSSFLLGHLLLEVADKGVSVGPEDDPSGGGSGGGEDDADAADLSAYPNLVRLEPELSQDQSLQEFEESLENLLERLERLGPGRRR